MGDWQDIVVTVVAAAGAFIVFSRTFGSWKDSKPGGAASPHCDGCALTKVAEDIHLGTGRTSESSTKVRAHVTIRRDRSS